jgi:DNA-binding MarR family transcriptional regulator
VRTIAETPAVPTDEPTPSDAIIAQFRTALRELRCMSGERMRRADVSYTTFHILSMLDRHGEMPMSRLADMLDVSLSNASGVIDRLEDRGFVERIRVPGDRRVVLVRATDQGRRTLTELEGVKDELLQSVLQRLDSAQLRRVELALHDLVRAAAAALAADPSLGHQSLGHHEHVHENRSTVPASPA